MRILVIEDEHKVASFIKKGLEAEHVWDQSFDSFTNIVDVYVRYLRNKIDRDFESKLIHTVRGVGYFLGEGDRP